MSTFLSLSPELVLSICERLSVPDLKQLRLSCKAIRRTADSLVLRKLRISAEATLDGSISYLQSFAQSPARRIAQDILIEDLSSLSPASSATNDSERSSVARNKRKIRELIMEALASLTAVRRVSWHPKEKDCLWIQETIWSVIQSFSALRYLHINTEFLRFTPTFKAFTTLESIYIDASACSMTSSLYTSLSKLYASCSTLTSLAILDESEPDLLAGGMNVDQIFSEYSKMVLPSRLRHLCLHDCLVHIDKSTLPHLHQLTSLELIDMPYKYLDGDIWSTFIGAGIQLEELVHDMTPPALFDYLSSYAGLKKLELSVSSFMGASSSDQAATRFFKDVLPRHVETLESLSLDSPYESEWCFTLRNAGVIGQCTKLHHLLMSVIQEEKNGGVDVVVNPRWILVKYLLDTVMRLPLITHLSLTAAFPEHDRYNACRASKASYRYHMNQEIKTIVENYQPPPSCSYLVKVQVGGEMFEGISDTADGRLKYQAVSNLDSENWGLFD